MPPVPLRILIQQVLDQFLVMTRTHRGQIESLFGLSSVEEIMRTWCHPLIAELQKKAPMGVTVEDGNVAALVVWPRALHSRMGDVMVDSVPGHMAVDLSSLPSTNPNQRAPHVSLDVDRGAGLLGMPVVTKRAYIDHAQRKYCSASEGVDLTRLDPACLLGYDLILSGSVTSDGRHGLLRVDQNRVILDLVPDQELAQRDMNRFSFATCKMRVRIPMPASL